MMMIMVNKMLMLACSIFNYKTTTLTAPYRSGVVRMLIYFGAVWSLAN
jgi:hypothetical protein